MGQSCWAMAQTTTHNCISSTGAQGLGFPFPCRQPSPDPAASSSPQQHRPTGNPLPQWRSRSSRQAGEPPPARRHRSPAEFSPRAHSGQGPAPPRSPTAPPSPTPFAASFLCSLFPDAAAACSLKAPNPSRPKIEP
jgi:hypothetical protein